MIPQLQKNLCNTPFNNYICNTCNKPLGEHFVFKATTREEIASVRGSGRHYCYTDGSSYCGGYHQRF